MRHFSRIKVPVLTFSQFGSTPRDVEGPAGVARSGRHFTGDELDRLRLEIGAILKPVKFQKFVN